MSDDQSSLPAAPPLSGYEVPATTPAAPPAVRLAALGILVLVLINLAGGLAGWTLRSRVADHLRASSGSRLTGSEIDTVATATVAVSMVIAVATAALLVWLGIKTLTGRNWARITLTVVLVLEVLSSGYSGIQADYGALPQVLNLASAALSVLVLVLLWAPAAARAYYAERPAA